jgi:hypothetical protein
LQREAQVDSPEFYQKDFFVPLGDMLQRSLTNVPDDVAAPDAVRPIPELNTMKEREAAAPKPPTGAASPATGTKSP